MLSLKQLFSTLVIVNLIVLVFILANVVESERVYADQPKYGSYLNKTEETNELASDSDDFNPLSFPENF